MGRWLGQAVRTQCILTTWGRTHAGYGLGRLGPGIRGRQYSHRVAWTQARGPIPDGLCVLHHCDNPPCIRVTPLRPDGTPDPGDHLWLGTVADNNRDCIVKGRARHATGERHGSRTHPERVLRGERQGRARLTEAAVLAIRASLAGGTSQRAQARAYGVSRGAIRGIAVGRTWAWLR